MALDVITVAHTRSVELVVDVAGFSNAEGHSEYLLDGSGFWTLLQVLMSAHACAIWLNHFKFILPAGSRFLSQSGGR